MATYVENLTTIRNNYAASLAAESAAPKPSYTIDGQSVNWDTYRASLLAAIMQLEERMTTAEVGEVELLPL